MASINYNIWITEVDSLLSAKIDKLKDLVKGQSDSPQVFRRDINQEQKRLRNLLKKYA